MSLIELYIPAIWRGVPFLVRDSGLTVGRRNAVHTYPYRDDPWPEDMGRGPRVMSFSARLVGDDVYLQRAVMAAACELEGPGLLVHPTLGPVRCSLVEPVTFRDRGDAQREVQFELVLMQAGSRVFPNLLLNTQNAILVAAAAAVLTVARVLVTELSSISSPAPVLSLGAHNVASAWGALAGAVSRDPGAIASEGLGLPGQHGRYDQGMLAVSAPASATITTQRAAVVASRTELDGAVASLVASSAAVVAQPEDFATASRSVVAAIAGATISPADRIRLLSGLAAYQPYISSTTAPIGADLATVRSAVGAVLRRQALIGLAEAIEAASPDNAQTAQQILTTFVQLIDAEIIIAADNAESGAYDMLRTLRTAVVSDLSARGARLASLVSYSFNVRMPAIALAYRLYQDASRTRDLISRANAAHPLFMPTQFQALDQ